MKIFFKDLSEYSIEKLIICSLEQALYQAVVVIDGQEHVVWDDEKTCVRSRNLMKIRERFEPLEIKDTFLRHESPYDEMIGMGDGAPSNRLEVRLGKDPYATASWLN